MQEEGRLPQGASEEHLHANLRAVRRRLRAAEMAEWDRQFLMLKHPGLTHSQAIAAERAAAASVRAASLSWDDLLRQELLRSAELSRERNEAAVAARRKAEQARAERTYAETMERAQANRGAIFPWRATVFIFLMILAFVAPFWRK